MKSNKEPCHKCGKPYIDTLGVKTKYNPDGYIYGEMWGYEFTLDKTLDENAHKYVKEITGRKLCDYCRGTGEIDVPIIEPLRN